MASKGRVLVGQEDTKLEHAKGVPTLELLQEEDVVSKDRLMSILWVMSVFTRHVSPRRQECEAKRLITRHKSIDAPTEGREMDFLRQGTAECKRRLSDQASVAGTLKNVFKKKDLAFDELKQKLETVADDVNDGDQSEDPKRKLNLEKLISEELSRHLDQFRAENSRLNRLLEFYKQTHDRSLGRLQSFFDNFIALCFCLPLARVGSRLHQLLKDFQTEIDQVWRNMKLRLLRGVEDDSDKEEEKETVGDWEDSKRKIITNTRKTQEVKLKIKESRKDLKKEHVEREQVALSMRSEITRLQRKIKDKEIIWANSSLTSARSIRVFVDYLETTCRTLFNKNFQMEKNITEIECQRKSLKERAEKLLDKIDWLRKQATKEAAVELKNQIRALKAENERMKELVKNLEKRSKRNVEDLNTVNKQERRYSMPLRLTPRTPGGPRSSLTNYFTPGEKQPSDSYDKKRLAGRSWIWRDGKSSAASQKMMLNQTTTLPRQFIKCLKCSVEFPVSEIDDYKEHVGQCYDVGSK
eukprot:m.99992 g.99992  ORF g.99992 m.99992 type:complete len:525 (+) comp37078_c0_seq9:1719-3293(+)